MQINEVNPNPQLQEAGEIVQQMYHKKRYVDWLLNLMIHSYYHLQEI